MIIIVIPRCSSKVLTRKQHGRRLKVWALSRVSFDQSESLRLLQGKCWHCAVLAICSVSYEILPPPRPPAPSILFTQHNDCWPGVNLWDATIYSWPDLLHTGCVTVNAALGSADMSVFCGYWKWNVWRILKSQGIRVAVGHGGDMSPFIPGSAPVEYLLWQDDESKGEEPDAFAVLWIWRTFSLCWQCCTRTRLQQPSETFRRSHIIKLNRSLTSFHPLLPLLALLLPRTTDFSLGFCAWK